jgi:Integrase core domain
LKNTPDMLLLKAVYEFGTKHGYKATIDAYGISKSTYYNYIRYYNSSLLSGKEHNFKSTKPHVFRKHSWDKKTVSFICKLRKSHPNLGKSKLKPYVDKFCKNNELKAISTGTIQNIINSFPNKLRTLGTKKITQHRKNVIRKPKDYKPRLAGECHSLDSMEFRKGSQKAFIVTCLDEVTKLLYARATYSHSSMSAKYILQEAQEYLAFDNVQYLLTDNGSEFMKNFAKYVNSLGITHYHTYPSSPKQNACCERVNRTIQDEFMIKYQDLLFNDLNAFNKQLDKYLRWYNFERVHGKFQNKITPYEKFRELTDCDKIVA